tara:strand:- start:123 stop:539 length:417 start_codon:yes stop_codon:yes gene_type:complete
MPRTVEQKALRKIKEAENRDATLIKERISREKRKDIIKEQKRIWNEKNKDRLILLRQTPEYKRRNRIKRWERQGVICDDFDSLHDYYENCKNCELCNVELTIDRWNTSTTRCLDHDHHTGLFRNVVCHSCNVSLPRQT